MTRGRRPGQRIGPYFGRRLIAESTPQRKARLHMAITQRELAERAGVSLKTVRSWEAGNALAWRTERALSDVVGLPLWLASQTGESSAEP